MTPYLKILIGSWVQVEIGVESQVPVQGWELDSRVMFQVRSWAGIWLQGGEVEREFGKCFP